MLQSSSRSHGRALLSSTRPRARPATTSRYQTLDSKIVLAVRSCDPWQQQCRYYQLPLRKKAVNYDVYHATNDLSEQLLATGLWDKGEKRRTTQVKDGGTVKAPKAKAPKVKGKKKTEAAPDAAKPDTEPDPPPAKRADKTRVHVTNEKLIADTINYLKPTLKRHRGCDLISVYPGVGAWTKALHRAIQPRSHLLLEPDTEFYRPFLQPLLKRRGVRMVPTNGIVWKELDKVLTRENFPHQKEVDPKDPAGPPRNDTLLVSMNLALFPLKQFQSFASISRMIVYQVLHSINTSRLYQKYGHVRMLIWIPDDEKSSIVPRYLPNRKKYAIDAELSTEYVGVVCSTEPAQSRSVSFQGAQPGSKPRSKSRAVRLSKRWPLMELESVRLAYQRMQESGMKTPRGRMSHWLRELLTLDPKLLTQPFPMTDLPIEVTQLLEGHDKEFKSLEAKHEKKPFPPDSLEYEIVRYGKIHALKRKKLEDNATILWIQYKTVLAAYEKAQNAAAQGLPSEDLLARAKKAEEAFDKVTMSLPTSEYLYWLNFRGSIHTLVNQPAHLGPVLTWDRRPYEPLPVTASDFFPNAACALLDIQPKKAHPLIRAMGPGTSNAGEVFDLMLGNMMDSPSKGIERTFASIWPAADEGVAAATASLTDPKQGGSPLRGKSALTNREVNREQLEQLLETWMDWPFKPSLAELLGTNSGTAWGEDLEADGVPGAGAAVGDLDAVAI